jgi:co-chaperonin GroES (HSP10)
VILSKKEVVQLNKRLGTFEYLYSPHGEICICVKDLLDTLFWLFEARETKETNDMAFKLTPLPGRILVQEDTFAYEGRVIIPEVAKRRPSTGTIIAVGENTTVAAKVGDKVVYPMYSGTGLRFRDPKTQRDMPPMRVLTPEEILCTITGDAELQEAGA